MRQEDGAEVCKTRRDGGWRMAATTFIAIAIALATGWAVDAARADEPASSVTFDDKTLAIIKSGDITRGASLAVQCKACHGAAGVSDAGLMPTLAGMNPLTIYKQLQDFRDGNRPWRDMTQIARLLSPQDMADLAVYWAAQPGLGKQSSGDETGVGAKLANQGDDKKGIPPCTACHGPQGNDAGAPPLAGQQAVYIEHQLNSFATGLRHNDLDGQMRTIATSLTPEQRHAVAAYFAGIKP